MFRTSFLTLSILISILLGNNVTPTNGVKRNRSVVNPSDIPASLLSKYNHLKSGYTTQGKKWRDGVIEHRKVVKVYPNTTTFHSDEVIVINSSFYDISGLSTITISENHLFSTTESVTTSMNVTVSGETALAVGALIYGVTLSNSLSAQTSFAYGVSTSYSSTYENANGFTATYNLSSIPNIPTNESIATCIVADYFECTASIKEEEYWFWGTYTTVDWQDFIVRFFTFHYITYCFSNGDRGVSTGRPY